MSHGQLIDTFAFVPTLLELYLAHRAAGAAGLYIVYVAGAICKTGSLWFNVSNHPPGQPADKLGEARGMRNQLLLLRPASAFRHLLLL